MLTCIVEDLGESGVNIGRNAFVCHSSGDFRLKRLAEKSTSR
jgi:hypothetical protein